MKLALFAPIFALAVLSAACSGNDGEISVEPGKTPLTDKGKDALFVVAVVDSRADGYAPDTLKVKVTPAGKEAIDVTCTLDDVNANKKLDKGDKISCVEGDENKLGADLGGKEVKVELFAKVGGKEERIGDADWTPAK